MWAARSDRGIEADPGRLEGEVALNNVHGIGWKWVSEVKIRG